MQNRKKKDTDLQNILLDSVGEGEGGMFQENSIETCILSRVKQITSPGWMHETSARTRCTGKTQRERVEREVGGGIGMGEKKKRKYPCTHCLQFSIESISVRLWSFQRSWNNITSDFRVAKSLPLPPGVHCFFLLEILSNNTQ